MKGSKIRQFKVEYATGRFCIPSAVVNSNWLTAGKGLVVRILEGNYNPLDGEKVTPELDAQLRKLIGKKLLVDVGEELFLGFVGKINPKPELSGQWILDIVIDDIVV